MNNLLIFGGTFDPVHLGHINTAKHIQQFFNFDQFAFLPCKQPVLDKSSLTSPSEHRLTMLNLALAEQDKHYHFYVDHHEISRNSPSYMTTTLEEFRQELGKKLPITLLMGLDAFCHLPQWHQWQKLIKLANLLVIARQGYKETPMPEEVKTLLRTHETTNQKTLLTTSHGLITRFDAGKYDISSTKIRSVLVDNKTIGDALPNSVHHYIIENKLYFLN